MIEKAILPEGWDERRLWPQAVKEFNLRLWEMKTLFSQYDPEVELQFYCEFRDSSEQASLYIRGRTENEILEAISAERTRPNALPEKYLHEIESRIALAIAMKPGHHKVPKVTWALPFLSWHQFALAADCAPIIGGKIQWNTDNPAWQALGKSARESRLVWAGDWPAKKREYPHVQLVDAKVRDVIGGGVVRDIQDFYKK